jgi:hypothetical protein
MARDRGSTSLIVVLLTPVFVVLAMMAFQAALWTHARTEARVIARDTAAMVARRHVAVDEAQRSATAVLLADTDLASPQVSIDVSGDLVTATITGRAPGMIRGMSVDVEVVEAVPVEGFRP